MKRFVFPLILLLAFVVRIVWLDRYPVGFTPDEASFGYDAYSLLTTGKDQWGQTFPLSLRSFGDFKLPFYAYLTIPSVAIFGLNEFSVRLPNALFGTLAVLVTYLMVLELTKDKKVALASSFFLAISPWHISLSRGAFETNLTTFFLPLGVYAFLKGLKNHRWMILSAFSFGLNLFSYHSARLITPLIVLFLLWWEKREISYKTYVLPGVIFSLFLLVSLIQLFGFSGRSSDIGIFNPTDKWALVSDKRYEGVLLGEPDSVSRIFSNKPLYIFRTFVGNYLSYFSPQFLFTQGAAETTYGMISGQGALYLIEIVFIVSGVIILAKRGLGKEDYFKFLLFWILISVIPAALTKGPGYAANRVAIMMPAVQIFSAFGFLAFLNVFSKFRRILVPGVLIILLISFVGFLEDYIYHSPSKSASGMLYGRREAVNFLSSVENNYKEIVVSKSLSEPQIFIAFYRKWDPKDYQKQSKDWMRYVLEGKSFVDQLGSYNLGKYKFEDINYTGRRGKARMLLVGKPEEFPEDISFMKVIDYPDGRPAIVAAENIQ